MLNKKNLIVLLSIMFLSVSVAFAGPFKANANTKRIPEGTKFKLEFIQGAGTYAGGIGDVFTAKLINEQSADSGVILPAGSIIRGSIGDIKTAKRFSRGAKLYLDFDHIVTPAGRQIPLDVAICSFDKIYYDGGLYKSLGYGEAIKNNYNKAADITKRSTKYGLSVRDTHPGLEYLTTPFCAAGGFIGGAGYFVGESIIDMFKKGQDVQINTGDVIDVKLLNPIDVPVY